jgi:hypothetical protein
MMTPPNQNQKPIVITRNRVPRITFIKRAALGKPVQAALWFFAGACTTIFLALLALVLMKFNALR